MKTFKGGCRARKVPFQLLIAISLIQVAIAAPEAKTHPIFVALLGNGQEVNSVEVKGSNGVNTTFEVSAATQTLRWIPKLHQIGLLSQDSQLSWITLGGKEKLSLDLARQALNRQNSSWDSFDVDDSARSAAIRFDAEGPIWGVDLKTGKAKQLIGAEVLRRLGRYKPGEQRMTYESGLNWSPDADLLAFSITSQRLLLEASGDQAPDTFVLNLRTGKTQFLGHGMPVGWLDQDCIVLFNEKDHKATMYKKGHALRSWSGQFALAGKGCLGIGNQAVSDNLHVTVFSYPQMQPAAKLTFKRSSTTITKNDLAIWSQGRI